MISPKDPATSPRRRCPASWATRRSPVTARRISHPFFDIDKLQPGDEIIVTTLNGRYVYHVTGTEVVAPDDYASVIPTTDVTKATLTLVSCTPRYSAKNRIVVRSELVPDQSDALTAAIP